jgi:hypothetical protein
MAAPKLKKLERAYGFDEVAIVPGDVTINPDQTNTNLNIGEFTFSVPILASAMDAVVDTNITNWEDWQYLISTEFNRDMIIRKKSLTI